MNRKRNVSYTKPEDPEFLKVLKKEAGYDDKNHKFDELENAEEDFVEDTDNEKPQVVVLKEGDLTAEEAEAEQKRIEKQESEAKADLSQRVIYVPKPKSSSLTINELYRRKIKDDFKKRNILSFDDDEDDDD